MGTFPLFGNVPIWQYGRTIFLKNLKTLCLCVGDLEVNNDTYNYHSALAVGLTLKSVKSPAKYL